jgi:hypothetical protein
MTQDEVEKKIRSYTKKKNIYFNDDNLILYISKYIIGEKFTEAKQKNYLSHLYTLFNGIKIGRGESLYDERNGKVVCTKIKSDIKKYMALHFETLSKRLVKKYKVYMFKIDDNPNFINNKYPFFRIVSTDN